MISAQEEDGESHTNQELFAWTLSGKAQEAAIDDINVGAGQLGSLGQGHPMPTPAGTFDMPTATCTGVQCSIGVQFNTGEFSIPESRNGPASPWPSLIFLPKFCQNYLIPLLPTSESPEPFLRRVLQNPPPTR